MVDSTTTITGNKDLIQDLNSGLQTNVTKAKIKDSGKSDFLTMLITQLKNQDPLDPMSNDRFAVDLAQFSSLERLINIDESLSKGTSGSGSSGIANYASFLGREVSVTSDEVTVADGNAGSVNFNLPVGVKSAKVDILNADGSVAKSIDTGALTSGRNRVALEDLGLSDGSYKVKVTAQGYSGTVSNPETLVGGIVTGLVPGENPVLLLGTREIKVSDISLVQVPPAGAY